MLEIMSMEERLAEIDGTIERQRARIGDMTARGSPVSAVKVEEDFLQTLMRHREVMAFMQGDSRDVQRNSIG